MEAPRCCTTINNYRRGISIPLNGVEPCMSFGSVSCYVYNNILWTSLPEGAWLGIYLSLLLMIKVFGWELVNKNCSAITFFFFFCNFPKPWKYNFCNYIFGVGLTVLKNVAKSSKESIFEDLKYLWKYNDHFPKRSQIWPCMYFQVIVYVLTFDLFRPKLFL